MGVSISAFAQVKEKEEEVIKESKEILTNTFTPIQLIQVWKEYANSLTEELHLKNTMINCLPNLINRDTFEVVVNNPMQEQRLLENGVDLLESLRSKLHNTQIQMKIRISEDNEKKLAFTSSEKFTLMLSENESLRILKDRFDLELL